MQDETVSAIPSYITSILRVIGASVGGYLIGKGYITAEQAPLVGGAALAVVTAAWALISSHLKTKKLNAAIQAPAGLAS